MAQGVTARRLGEGRVTNLASRLIASVKLSNWIGSLPLSSRDRGSCGGASPGELRQKLHTELSSSASTPAWEAKF